MWWRLGLVGVAAAGCYSGHAAAGAPCTPQLDNCPTGQTCALVAGDYVCVAGAVGDAAVDDAADAGLAPDARADARLDAATDAAPDAAPAVPWSLIQTTDSTTSSLTMSASGSGHLIVIAIETNVGAVTALTDNAGNTYTATANGRATQTALSRGLEVWYAVNSKPGATTVTVTAPTVYAVVMWEVAGIRTSAPLQTLTKLDNQATTTMPLGAAITTTQPGELVVATAVVDNVVSGIHSGSPFTNDHTTFDNGWAHLTSKTAPAGTYQAAWDQPSSGVYCAVSAAFFVGP